MTSVDRQPHDVARCANTAFAALPSNDFVLSSFASVKEGVKRHDDNKRPHSDVNLSVADFKFRNVLNELWQTTQVQSPTHCPEQQGIGRADLRKVNAVTEVNGLISTNGSSL